MKIGMAVNNLSVSGGYQKLVLKLGDQLIKSGHEISIYTLDVNKRKCYPEIIDLVNIESIPHKQEVPRKNLFKKITNLIFGRILLINNYRRLAGHIPNNLDALIIHDEYCLYLLPWISKKNGTRIVWMLNNQLSNNFNSIAEIISNIFSPFQGMKSILIRLADLPQFFVSLFLLRLATKKVDEFAVYDSTNKKLVEQKIKRNSTIVFAGADLEKFKTIFRKRTFLNKNEYTLISVGVFFPHRRHEDLISAIALLKKENIKIKALIIGRQDQDQKYSNKIISQISNLGLEDEVKCIQTVSDSEMLSLYENSDIFCFVNNGHTWGISVFEAIAAGLPVIITDNVGAADIIKNEVSGFIVKPCNPQEIATAIKKIISNNDKTNSIIQTAYNTTGKIVSWESFSKRILELINK